MYPTNSMPGTMTTLSNQNFGLIIANLVPGFIALWGLQDASPTVKLWLSTSANTDQLPTVGGFFYVTLASIAMSMMLSSIRWCLIDTLHHYTGKPRPKWNDAVLQEKLAAFDLLVQEHYRYYQFYANSLVALIVGYAGHRYAHGFAEFNGHMEIVLFLLIGVFWATSRSNLHRYYTRVTTLMNT